jgi:hypothetical protein
MWFIYIIKSSNTDKVYIGSTSRPICQRLAQHKCHYKSGKGNCTINQILEYGEDDITQELLEEVDTTDRRILLQHERRWIENTPNTVNLYIPHRSAEEARQIYNERAKARVRAITQPTKCECGFTYYYGRKEEHEKTRRHRGFVEKGWKCLK